MTGLEDSLDSAFLVHLLFIVILQDLPHRLLVLPPNHISLPLRKRPRWVCLVDLKLTRLVIISTLSPQQEKITKTDKKG